MIKTIGNLVSVGHSEKSNKDFALFMCGKIPFSVYIDVSYIPQSVELVVGKSYLIDISPFYSEAKDECFLGYRVLGKYGD